jgi:GH15 family glucan-1,4-alpha-glucosidase
VIGDRRTGALIAADGSIDWFCAPDFDGTPIFGSLLDPKRGGCCRLSPGDAGFGEQSYLGDTAALSTRWESGAEVADVMGWPMEEREIHEDRRRVIIRRLTSRDSRTFHFEVHPRENFAELPEPVLPAVQGAVFSFRSGVLTLWASFPVAVIHDRAFAEVTLNAGDEHWVIIGWDIGDAEWSRERAARTFEKAHQYWRRWSSNLKVEAGGERAPALRRSALTVQLLSHAKHDCAVAALTTSLPERIGGDRNYDYRYAWVRDASLSLALLARMGKAGEVEHYLEWLCHLHSSTVAPLQVCYGLDSSPVLDEKDIQGPMGYEGSLPVRCGNRAAKQLQLGSMGFLADCVGIYLDNGGRWREEFWELLKRAADFSCKNWQAKDSGIWELAHEAHYTASRVMCWVILVKAVQIAAKTGHAGETGMWSETAARIHEDVMEHGWSEKKQSFRQRYGSDALDAASLLIPLMDFLPADHPRVIGTLKAMERELVIDGLIHRFVPADTLEGEQLPLGKFEGAFLPCVFWHAHALAKMGRCDEAESILTKCEKIAGRLGMFAEEIDAERGIFLGNTPLLFAQVEYVRAVTQLNQTRAALAREDSKDTK